VVLQCVPEPHGVRLHPVFAAGLELPPARRMITMIMIITTIMATMIPMINPVCFFFGGSDGCCGPYVLLLPGLYELIYHSQKIYLFTCTS
jgi:hypothetical protein